MRKPKTVHKRKEREMTQKKNKVSEMSVLVDVTVGAWNNTVTDEKATEAAIDQMKANNKAGKFRKNRIAQDAMSSLGQLNHKVRNTVKKYTVDWEPEGKRGGFRLLPTALFDKCTEELRKVVQEREDAKQVLYERWPELLEAAEVNLGEMFHPEEYPTAEEVRDAWYYHIDFQPVPNISTVVLDLHESAMEEIKTSMETQMSEKEKNLVFSVGTRLYGVLNKMLERLSSDRNPSEKSCHAMVRDINDLVDILPALNITGDKEIASLAKDVAAKLAKLDPGQIKEDPAFRATKAEETKAILDRMGAYATLAGDDAE
jgi:hypothetical protein